MRRARWRSGGGIGWWLHVPVALVAAALLLLIAPVALADYSGSTSAASKTVRLVGTGAVRIWTEGGLLHHGNLGPAFAAATDFDSAEAGTQSVPDTGQWTVDVTGGGRDSLEIDEREPTSPVSYTSGHTYYPGGAPCVVRDPNSHEGQVIFSLHPKQETRFCYPHGIDRVTVRAGSGAAQFGVLDTASGVPLHFFGSRHGTNYMTESADVPTSVGGYHMPMSPVYFTGGGGEDVISLDDGTSTSPARYVINANEIHKSGLPPLHYATRNPSSALWLYPQAGPSNIRVGPTGGIFVQIFGNFSGQKGPDRIDASGADAQVGITGSLGKDTIFASPAGGFVQGGGGNPTIYALSDSPTQIECAPSGANKGTVWGTTLDQIKHCHVVHRQPPVVVLRDLSFSPARVPAGSKLTLAFPSYEQGQLALTFERKRCAQRGGCRYQPVGTRTVHIRLGQTGLRLTPRVHTHGRQVTLPAGTYRVVAQLTSSHWRSKADRLGLVIG
jgi:hypothetical protein